MDRRARVNHGAERPRPAANERHPRRLSNPFTWTIPSDAANIGLTVSVHGHTIVGSQCLGSGDLSDTIDFTVR